jgi:hypothetical protein
MINRKGTLRADSNSRLRKLSKTMARCTSVLSRWLTWWPVRETLKFFGNCFPKYSHGVPPPSNSIRKICFTASRVPSYLTPGSCMIRQKMWLQCVRLELQRWCGHTLLRKVLPLYIHVRVFHRLWWDKKRSQVHLSKEQKLQCSIPSVLVVNFIVVFIVQEMFEVEK